MFHIKLRSSRKDCFISYKQEDTFMLLCESFLFLCGNVSEINFVLLSLFWKRFLMLLTLDFGRWIMLRLIASIPSVDSSSEPFYFSMLSWFVPPNKKSCDTDIRYIYFITWIRYRPHYLNITITLLLSYTSSLLCTLLFSSTSHDPKRFGVGKNCCLS